MTTPLKVSAVAEIDAPASDAYWMIADYKRGHPQIVPPKVFRNLEVEGGSGYGDGTTIRYDVHALGRTIRARAKITEPDPGRVLVETDIDQGAVTTFTVEPLGPARTRVTIATEAPTKPGVSGVIERVLAKSFLQRVYITELERLEEQVKNINRFRE